MCRGASDYSVTGMKIRSVPRFLQDRREVGTVNSTNKLNQDHPTALLHRIVWPLFPNLTGGLGRLKVLVLHDDAEREYAYGPAGPGSSRHEGRRLHPGFVRRGEGGWLGRHQHEKGLEAHSSRSTLRYCRAARDCRPGRLGEVHLAHGLAEINTAMPPPRRRRLRPCRRGRDRASARFVKRGRVGGADAPHALRRAEGSRSWLSSAIASARRSASQLSVGQSEGRNAGRRSY